jgi:hypothetical protein
MSTSHSTVCAHHQYQSCYYISSYILGLDMIFLQSQTNPIFSKCSSVHHVPNNLIPCHPLQFTPPPTAVLQYQYSYPCSPTNLTPTARAPKSPSPYPPPALQRPIPPPLRSSISPQTAGFTSTVGLLTPTGHVHRHLAGHSRP